MQINGILHFEADHRKNYIPSRNTPFQRYSHSYEQIAASALGWIPSVLLSTPRNFMEHKILENIQRERIHFHVSSIVVVTQCILQKTSAGVRHRVRKAENTK